MPTSLAAAPPSLSAAPTFLGAVPPSRGEYNDNTIRIHSYLVLVIKLIVFRLYKRMDLTVMVLLRLLFRRDLGDFHSVKKSSKIYIILLSGGQTGFSLLCVSLRFHRATSFWKPQARMERSSSESLEQTNHHWK